MGGNTADIAAVISADTMEATANKSDVSLTNKSEDLSPGTVLVNFTLTRLSPHTDYVITVEANTSAGYGNRSEELHIQTAPGRCVCAYVCVHMCACVCVHLNQPRNVSHSASPGQSSISCQLSTS